MLLKELLGYCRAKIRSPSDSTSKTEERAPSFISVKYNFGSEKGKIFFFLKKGRIRTPFFGHKKGLLYFSLAIQSDWHVQGQDRLLPLTESAPKKTGL